MRSPRTLLLLLATAFAVTNIAVTIHRSLIPVGLDGQVVRVDVLHEKHPGIDDVGLLHVAARRIHVDAGVARHVADGASVTKRPWSSTLLVDGQPVPIGLSGDATAMLCVMPLTVLTVAAAAVAGRRSAAR